MSTVLPQNEKIRQAVRWVSDRLQEPAGPGRFALINQAAERFDLTPQETEFLFRFHSKSGADDAGH